MCNEEITIIVENTINSTEVTVNSQDISISVDVLESVNNISVESIEQVNEVFIDALTQDYAVEVIVDEYLVPFASDTISGKMKLYNALGVNIDGSVTQNIVKTNLDLKVDKVAGYSLTQNNLTDALKALYDSAVLWISTNGATLISHLTNTNNPHSVTKSQVGLSDVPNTDFTSAVSLNTSKVGITTTQSSNIVTNNSKISYTSVLADLKVDKVVGKSLLLDSEALRLTKFSGGRTEVDFGALPINEKEFTITDATVLATSNITAEIAYEAPTGKELDEIEMDSFNIICGQATNGTFKIIVKSLDGSYLADKFKINYSITI